MLRWKNGDGAANSAFLEALQQAGAEVSPGEEPGEARAVVSAEWPGQQFFHLAKRAEVTLTGVEPEEMDLSTVYRRLVGIDAAAPPLIGLAKGAASGVATS